MRSCVQVPTPPPALIGYIKCVLLLFGDAQLGLVSLSDDLQICLSVSVFIFFPVVSLSFYFFSVST